MRRRMPRSSRMGRSGPTWGHRAPDRDRFPMKGALPMKGTLRQDGKATEPTQENIEQAVAGAGFFWLDLDIHDPGPDDDVSALLTNTFHFHPVAVEAVDRFGQRPRIDDYDDFVHVIPFG